MHSSCHPSARKNLQTWWKTVRCSKPLHQSSRRFKSHLEFWGKPSIDIKHIVKNPGLYEQNCNDRNYKQHAKSSWGISESLKAKAQLDKDAIPIRQQIRRVERDISRLTPGRHQKSISNKSEAQGVQHGELNEKELPILLAEASTLRPKLAEIISQSEALENKVQELALALPNLSSVHSPTGDVASTIEKRAVPPEHAEKSTSHVDIGLKLDLLDFVSAAATSGAGWYYLKNEAALLEQALVQFALSELYQRGWQIISPPTIVYSHVVAACGFQPRNEDVDQQQIYQLAQTEKDQSRRPLCLAATAEIPLAGLYKGQKLQGEQLPLKVAAVSRCYRPEAGGDGVKRKGLYRVREFTKVEMFAWTASNEDGSGDGIFGIGSNQQSASERMFTEMVEIQKSLLDRLGLSYRVLEMPTMDLGASATRKQDIEVYFPSRQAINDGYGEVTSASICTDYQTRRLNTTVKDTGEMGKWPHTVNGTAIAVPRILAALLETHWDEASKTVRIPKALQPWMFGMQEIKRSSSSAIESSIKRHYEQQDRQVAKRQRQEQGSQTG